MNKNALRTLDTMYYGWCACVLAFALALFATLETFSFGTSEFNAIMGSNLLLMFAGRRFLDETEVNLDCSSNLIVTLILALLFLSILSPYPITIGKIFLILQMFSSTSTYPITREEYLNKEGLIAVEA